MHIGYNTMQYQYNTNTYPNPNAMQYDTIQYNAIQTHIEYNKSHTDTIPIQYNTIHINNNSRGSGSKKDSLRDHPRTLMQGRSVGR